MRVSDRYVNEDQSAISLKDSRGEMALKLVYVVLKRGLLNFSDMAPRPSRW